MVYKNTWITNGNGFKEIEKLIKEALPNATVEIQDLAGDGNHYSTLMTSPPFSGKSKIEQHKTIV